MVKNLILLSYSVQRGGFPGRYHTAGQAGSHLWSRGIHSKLDWDCIIPKTALAKPQSQIPHIYFNKRNIKFPESVFVVLIWKYTVVLSSGVLKIVIYSNCLSLFYKLLYISVWKYEDSFFEIVIVPD
jgi:hypothetical protein